nr:hypothetical protein HUO10_003100 [Paraburkholderia busanensis]
MSDPHDNSIPVLHEILVPGNPVQTRRPSGDAAADETSPHDKHAPREPSFRAEPVFTPSSDHAHEPTLAREAQAEPELDPELAPQPVLTEDDMLAAEPVLPAEPMDEPPPLPTLDEVLAPGRGIGADAAHDAGALPPAKKRARGHHAHDETPERDAGVFGRTEPLPPAEAGAIVPPDLAHQAGATPQPGLDADLIAERLRGRFAGFLTGEGRGIIEARCRDALQEHTGWLVNQITREVALTLETEMTAWVREAVEEEIARRNGHA